VKVRLQIYIDINYLLIFDVIKYLDFLIAIRAIFINLQISPMSATKLIKETKLKSFIEYQYTALSHSTVFLIREDRMMSNDILLRKKHKGKNTLV